MSQRFGRLTVSLLRIHKEVRNISVAVADGAQPGDKPVIDAACERMLSQLAEAEDVEMDLLAARRALTVGRRAVYDARFRSRDRDLARVRARYRVKAKTPTTAQLAGVSIEKQSSHESSHPNSNAD